MRTSPSITSPTLAGRASVSASSADDAAAAIAPARNDSDSPPPPPPPLLPDARPPPVERTTCNQAIEQSSNQAIKQSNNQAIKRQRNHARCTPATCGEDDGGGRVAWLEGGEGLLHPLVSHLGDMHAPVHAPHLRGAPDAVQSGQL
eukprot:5910130-Prymnesium_polylepis.1